VHGCRVEQERINLKSTEDDFANDRSIILSLFDESQFSEKARLIFGLKQTSGRRSPIVSRCNDGIGIKLLRY